MSAIWESVNWTRQFGMLPLDYSYMYCLQILRTQAQFIVLLDSVKFYPCNSGCRFDNIFFYQRIEMTLFSPFFLRVRVMVFNTIFKTTDMSQVIDKPFFLIFLFNLNIQHVRNSNDIQVLIKATNILFRFTFLATITSVKHLQIFFISLIVFTGFVLIFS